MALRMLLLGGARAAKHVANQQAARQFASAAGKSGGVSVSVRTLPGNNQH
jgi:hypothetical protein